MDNHFGLFLGQIELLCKRNEQVWVDGWLWNGL